MLYLLFVFLFFFLSYLQARQQTFITHNIANQPSAKTYNKFECNVLSFNTKIWNLAVVGSSNGFNENCSETVLQRRVYKLGSIYLIRLFFLLLFLFFSFGFFFLFINNSNCNNNLRVFPNKLLSSWFPRLRPRGSTGWFTRATGTSAIHLVLNDSLGRW